METIGELLAAALTTLDGLSSSPRLDAEVLLALCLGSNRTHLRTWPGKEVSVEQSTCFRALIARRTQGEPIAHLTGEREFWSLPLEVTTHTLIPRPETERLVEVALTLIPRGKPSTIADLGTGSGAVAAAIATERPDSRIIATDICPQALTVAGRNLTRLALDNVTLRQGHWCDALAGQRFALIVSNPPYVASGDPHLQRGDTRFEPRLALSAGDDGLDAIREITKSAATHLLPGAALVIEHGHDQGAAVQDLFRRHGYREVQGYRDLGARDRVVSGVL
jgi:release factor glutamine methyltransferase